jgi:hypothetical protein
MLIPGSCPSSFNFLSPFWRPVKLDPKTSKALLQQQHEETLKMKYSFPLKWWIDVGKGEKQMMIMMFKFCIKE